MTTTIRAQLLELRTLRSSTLLVTIVVAMVAAITAGTLSEVLALSGATAAELREPLFASAGVLTAAIVGMFAAVKTAGGYRHRTLSLQVLAEPRRARLFAATLSTYGLAAAALSVSTLLVGAAISIPMAASAGLELGLTVPMLAAGVLAVALFTLLGSSVGVICRSQPAAMAVLVGVFIAEKLFGGFLGEAAAYLPYALLTPLLSMPGATLAPTTAALALTIITAGITFLAAVLFSRRDIA
jgi:ABC-2 type transport system permease protein